MNEIDVVGLRKLAAEERDRLRADVDWLKTRIGALVADASPGELSPLLGHAALVPMCDEQFDVFVYVLAPSDYIAREKAMRVQRAIEAGVRMEVEVLTLRRVRDAAEAHQSIVRDHLSRFEDRARLADALDAALAEAEAKNHTGGRP